MMTVYPDTTMLLSLYLPDRHSRQARQLLRGAFQACVTPLHRAEWAHAIGLHVERRQMTPEQAFRVTAAFERHRREGYWRDVAVPDSAFETWASLAQRTIPGARTYTLDALHVACAIELRADRFWTFDPSQAVLAAGLGLSSAPAP